MTTDPIQSRTTAARPISNNNKRFQRGSLAIAVGAVLLLAFQPGVSWTRVFEIGESYGTAMSVLVLIFLLVQFIGFGIWYRLKGRSAKIEVDEAWYRTFFANPRWGDIPCALLALMITVSCFTVFKSTAVGADGYGFDAVFIAWDRAIFGGNDPWVLTHAIMPSAYATSIVDYFYHPAFLPMVIGYVLCTSAHAKPALRYTYMTSYLASFVIIGMVLANVLHSAGPVYDGILYGDGTHFAPLVERLAAQRAEVGSLNSVWAQDYLLRIQQSGEIGLGSGISAMPSMHIVLAFLWVFAGWHINRVLGVILTFYGCFIWFGSVHLGWHYFVDGLVALTVFSVIWYTAGRFFGLYGPNQVIRATT